MKSASYEILFLMINILYHQSPSSNRHSILSLGLISNMDKTGFGAVFMRSMEPNHHLGMDIWAINPVGLVLEVDSSTDAPEGDDWYCTYSNIPAQSMNLIENISPGDVVKRKMPGKR